MYSNSEQEVQNLDVLASMSYGLYISNYILIQGLNISIVSVKSLQDRYSPDRTSVQKSAADTYVPS